jgi:hypothetical protein
LALHLSDSLKPFFFLVAFIPLGEMKIVEHSRSIVKVQTPIG